MTMIDLNEHAVLPYETWFEAHRSHLEKEKAFSKCREALAAERRALPWLKISKDYVFDTEQGPRSLSELFDGRSQLIVYHFMLAPQSDHRCLGCSFLADHIDATIMHVSHHDISFVVASRAPLAEILLYKHRMGWHFNWVSSGAGDFNYDFEVSFTPEQIALGKVMFNFHERPVGGEDRGGTSIFYKNARGEIFHTFAVRGRGGENLIGTYGYLDLLPKGRAENGPDGTLSDWVHLHDEYGNATDRHCF